MAEASRGGRVYPERPYRPHALGSLSRASCILLRKFKFPVSDFGPQDKHFTVDHDRIVDRNSSRASRCFKEHTGSGEGNFENWLASAWDDKVMAFLKDFLEPNASETEWTGYRVLGSVHQGNGWPVFSLELFAKHSESTTEVVTLNPVTSQRIAAR